MTKASDNLFPSLLLVEGTEPAAPAAGTQRLYIDSTTHLLKATNSSGTDRTIEASGILASTSYSTGSDAVWAASSSTTTADIDATNAALAITVPASGKIVVTVSIDFTYGTANTGGYIVLRQGSTDLQAASCIAHNIGSGGIGAGAVAAGHMANVFVVSGLTPGALTIKLGFRRIGSTVLNVYANDGAGTAGHLASPFTMVAWAA